MATIAGRAGPRPTPRRRWWPSRQVVHDNLIGYLFFSPWLIGLVLFNIFPILSAVYYSFTEYSVLQPPRWVGLNNFNEMFYVDELFWKAVYNTLYYAIFSVPLGLLFAIVLAMLLNYKVWGLAFFRATFFLPSIVPGVAAAVVWAWILNPEYGLVNDMLARFGLPGPPWLTSEVWSKPAFILMSLWGIGSTAIIFLAALQDIPQHLYEAAEIDGANLFHRARFVTLPMLTPAIFFNLIMGVIGALQIFTQVYVISDGGPLWSTLFYVFYLYRQGFQYFNMGYASALSLVLFVITLIFTLILMLTSRRWVYYEGAQAR
ncbi:MAG: sugar ABC transporter permease [Caldilineaceae bacterium]|nr:sugar ABC transporter permease [Caldilineaceae bacterium]